MCQVKEATFSKHIVDKVLLSRVYIPEVTGHVLHISFRKTIYMKGNSSGAVLELRNIVSSNNWSNT